MLTSHLSCALREDPNGQYWMGAVRDPQNPTNWKWITGQDLGVSFWSLPGGQENCARFDGTKDWLWSDTDCNVRLNFICQHRQLGEEFNPVDMGGENQY